MTEKAHQVSILIVEDNESIQRTLVRVLEREGHDDLTVMADAAEVLGYLEKNQVELILLDVHLPGTTGLELLSALQDRIDPERRPQIIVMTGDDRSSVRYDALAMGAADFLTKPLDAVEIGLRVRNLLRTIALQAQIRRDNARLEEQVRARTEELDQTQVEVLERLSRAAEYRDDDTVHHTRRVAKTSGKLAEMLGLGTEYVELITRAALLHDVGKISLSDAVLLKPGPLTPEERKLMERHTVVGASILSKSKSKALQIAEEIAISHHEWWDGSGYPNGLAGTQIPLTGRIVAVADSLDALTSERPYKEAWTVKAAMREIRAQSGIQFDPRVVRVLEELLGMHPSDSDGDQEIPDGFGGS